MAVHDSLFIDRIPHQPQIQKISFSQKLWNIIDSIIEFIKSFFPQNPFKLTPADRVTIRDIKIIQGQIKPPSPVPAPVQPQANPEIEPINLNVSILRAPTYALEPVQFEHKYLNDTAAEVIRIASDSADLIYEKDVAPVIALIQQGSKGIPDLLKTIAGVILKLGQAANKHYGTVIEKSELSGIVTNELRNLVHWLCLNDFTSNRQERNDYKTQLYNKVRLRLAVDIRTEMKHYLEPTLHWLLQTDHQTPFKNCFDINENYNEEHAKEMLGAAVHVLIEFKIDLYAQYVNSILQNNLPQIVQTYLRENVAKMAANEEMKTLLTVIKELPWSNLVDDAINFVHYHLIAYVNGIKAQEAYEKNQKEDRELQQRITLYKARIAAKANNAEEIRIQDEAKSDLAFIANNHEKTKEQSFWTAFADTKINPIEYAIHPTVRANEVEAQAQANHEFFGELANQLLDLALPGDKNNIDSWLDKLTVPPQFKEIIEHTKNIVKEVVSPALLGIMSLPPAWQRKISEETANIVIIELKKWLKEILVLTLEEKLTQYADPDEIDEMMADQLLPNVIIPQMIQTTAKHVLFLNVKGFSQDFTNLVGLDRNAALISIQERFFQGSQALLTNVPFPTIQMTQAKFNEVIQPLMTELESRLENIKRIDPPSFSREKVEVLLSKYFEDDKAVEDSRPVYGKLVTDMIAEMSTAGGWAKWGVKKGEEALSKILVASMHDVRVSPEFTVKLLTESLSKTMAKDKLPGLFFGAPGQTRSQIRESLAILESRIEQAESIEHPTVAQEAELGRLVAEHMNHRLVSSRKKLAVNLQILSNLIYDVAMAKIHYLGGKMTQEYAFSFLSGWGASASQYLGAGIIGTPKQLNDMITDLYQKLVGDMNRNRSLINQIAGLFVKAMSEKSRRLRV